MKFKDVVFSFKNYIQYFSKLIPKSIILIALNHIFQKSKLQYFDLQNLNCTLFYTIYRVFQKKVYESF